MDDKIYKDHLAGAINLKPQSLYHLTNLNAGADTSCAFVPAEDLSSSQAMLLHLGGWLTIPVGISSAAMFGVSGFTFYSTYHQVYVFPSTMTGSVINTANISATLAAASLVVSATYAYALTLVGRYWLAVHLANNRPISVGQWAAIASKGAILQLRNLVEIGNGIFIITLLCCWAIPSVIVGLLSPSIDLVTVRTQVRTARITGNGGNKTADVMQRCDAGQPNSCPAALDPENIALAVRNGLMGHGRYPGVGLAVVGDYLTPWQGGFWNLDGSDTVGGSGDTEKGLSDPLLHVVGYARPTRPVVDCIITKDDTAITMDGGQANFETVCGPHKAGRADIPFGIYTTGCLIQDHTYTLYGTLVGLPAIDAGATTVAQCICKLRVEEREQQLLFYPPNILTLRVQRDVRWTQILVMEELAPVATSIWYALNTSPTINGISAITAPLVWALKDNRTDLLENMVVNGANAAIHRIYLHKLPLGEGGLNSTASEIDLPLQFAYVKAVINAYAWGRGWKAYAYGSAAAFLGLIGASAVMFGYRNGFSYDPSDWSKTVAISVSSANRQAGLQQNTLDLDPGQHSIAIHQDSGGEYWDRQDFCLVFALNRCKKRTSHQVRSSIRDGPRP